MIDANICVQPGLGHVHLVGILGDGLGRGWSKEGWPPLAIVKDVIGRCREWAASEL